MNNRFLLALTNKSFLFLWLSEVFAQVAMNMLNFILLLVAYAITNSSTAVSGIVIAFAIPAIIFGILAGVYVDRWNKKHVLFATNMFRAGLVLFLAFIHTNLFLLYGITFVVSIITQFFIPAETPMIPTIVEKKLLLSANALFGIAIFGSILIAYALSGPFLILFGTKNAFMAITIMFLISAFFVLLIQKTPEEKKRSTKLLSAQSNLKEIKSTLSTIFKVKNIFHSLFLLALAQIIIFIIAVIGPGYAQHILRIRISEFPLLFVTPAVIGMGVGTIVLSNFFHKHRKQHTATAGLFLMAMTLFLLPYGSRITSRSFVHGINVYLPHMLKVNNLHLMVVLAGVLGFANALIFVPSNTIVQEETSEEIRGKVYGAMNTITSLLSILPVILVGTIADIFGVAAVLTTIAIGVALIAVARFFI